MPRSSSSGRSHSRPSFKPTISMPATKVPAQTNIHHTVEAPTFGQSMKQGFGFGMGSAIAHKIFGPKYVGSQTIPTETVISNPEYEKCMKESFNDKEACKQYLSEGK